MGDDRASPLYSLGMLIVVAELARRDMFHHLVAELVESARSPAGDGGLGCLRLDRQDVVKTHRAAYESSNRGFAGL